MKATIIKYLYGLVAMAVSFLTPIKPYIMIVGTAVLLDAFIAIYLAIRQNGPSAFESKRLKDTVAKTFIYIGALLLTRQIDLLYNIDTVMRVIFGVILLTELRSIDEKYYRLYGKSLFNWIINRLPNMNKEKDKTENNGGFKD